MSGSDFTEAHMSGRRTAIINERAARRFFDGTDPRGKQFRMGGEFEIIGVVRDARVNALRDGALPTVFVPYGHTRPRGMLVFAVRTGAAHDGVMASMVREARAIDPLVPMRIVPLERVRDASLARDRLLAKMSTFFAAAALALLAIGLFGLLTFRVQQRTTEIGVRVALGANVGTVVWLVLQQPLRLAAAGTVAGTALTLATTGLLRSLLFGLSPTDVPTLTASVAAVVALVLLSACIPAWRAARLNPIVALRHE
jgi:putative ABC transport system permease protein